MKAFHKRVIRYGVILAGSVLMLGALAQPFMARSSNCGGNSAALNACRSVHLSFRVIASEHEVDFASIADLTPTDREQFNCVSGLSWIGDAKIMVNSRPLHFDSLNSNVVLAVCDTPFRNVPQRRWFKTPPRHAVVYADGRTDLITVDRFKRMDLSGFVDVRSLQRKPEFEEPGAGSRDEKPSVAH